MGDDDCQPLTFGQTPLRTCWHLCCHPHALLPSKCRRAPPRLASISKARHQPSPVLTSTTVTLPVPNKKSSSISALCPLLGPTRYTKCNRIIWPQNGPSGPSFHRSGIKRSRSHRGEARPGASADHGGSLDAYNQRLPVGPTSLSSLHTTTGPFPSLYSRCE